MTEQWIKWEPMEGLSAKYFIESIMFNREILRVILINVHDKNQKIQVLFDKTISTFRVTNGVLRLKTIDTINKKYGATFCDEWTFFKVTNSEYVQSLVKDSCETYDPEKFNHLVLIGENSIIEFADSDKPIVSFING